MNPNDILNSIIGGFSVFFMLSILRSLGIDIFPKLSFSIRCIIYGLLRLVGKKYILVYADCTDGGVSVKNLSNALSKKQKFKCISLNNPEHFLHYPLFPIFIHSVVFLVTNVSQLSTDKNKKTKIEKRLVKYCLKGGKLVLGHDALYWRTENEEFQCLAGGVLNSFHTVESKTIEYLKNDGLVSDRILDDDEYMQHLPTGFKLHDKELLHGQWANGVRFLYVTNIMDKNNKGVYSPLVTRNSADKGYVYWVNTGDNRPHNPPKPINLPDQDFVDLLVNLLLVDQRV